MSTFSKDEVEGLKSGGNKRGKAIWYAKYDETKLPPIKSSDTAKLKEKIEKCYEKKEWYDPKGKVKKVIKNQPSADNGQKKEKEKEKEKSTSPSKPVSSANIMGDLLDFESKPEQKAKDDGNPFEDDEEEDEENADGSDDDFADFGGKASNPPVPAKNQPAPVTKPPPKNEPDLFSVIAQSQSNPPFHETSSNQNPEAASLDMLIRTLKEIGTTYKFSKDKMLSLVDEALVKVNLKTPGAANSTVNIKVSAPQQPVQSDIFAEAEKQTLTRGPPSFGGASIYAPPSNGGVPSFTNAMPPAVNRSDNPFEDESSNPFLSQSPPKPMANPPVQIPNPGAQAYNPFPVGGVPPMMPYPMQPQSQFPGMMPQFTGMMPPNQPPQQMYPGPGMMAQPQMPMNPQAANQQKQQKDQELFKDFAMFK
jgi:hypothetical protein